MCNVKKTQNIMQATMAVTDVLKKEYSGKMVFPQTDVPLRSYV